jgi:aminoglycoside phosphotransferase (APT) family kinase protein
MDDRAAGSWTDAAFGAHLAKLLEASRVRVVGSRRLTGGAIQHNDRLDVEVDGGPWSGTRAIVVRSDAASRVAASRTRAQEFALLRAASAGGVRVPPPIAFDAGDVDRAPFMLMGFVAGEASGHRLTKQAGDHAGLLRTIGANLARLHAVPLAQPSLSFLGAPADDPTRELIASYRESVTTWRARTDDARPVIEWTLRWLEAHLPAPAPPVLVHRDYRVGNLLVDGGELAATLDWEFAGVGDPREDLGWFAAPCWRFARPDREAGGLGELDDLLDGYNAAAGTRYAARDLAYWQVLGQLRWAVVALQQALRFLDGGERSLELALTGRLLPALEWRLLAMTGDTFG